MACTALLGCGAADLKQDSAEAPPTKTKTNASLVPQGVASGEITPTSATIWSRGTTRGYMHAVVKRERGSYSHYRTAVTSDRAFVGWIPVSGLSPSTRYIYRVWFSQKQDEPPPDAGFFEGQFRTAPAPEAKAPVKLVFSGDLGGANICRDTTQGYPIFEKMQEESADFFVAMGDMIYADNPCKQQGAFGNEQIPGPTRPANSLKDYREAWKYNRSDAAFKWFLSTTPMFSTWDDHETINNVSPHEDWNKDVPEGARRRLMPTALRAFLEYRPALPVGPQGKRIYRRIHYGKHLEVFLLDTRQYRDANTQKDTANTPKTLLGPAQLSWLLEGLKDSNATWKVIASSVPLSLKTGSEDAQDSWANMQGDYGFERELQRIVDAAVESDIRTLVWLSGDVHFAAAYAYRASHSAQSRTREPKAAGRRPTTRKRNHAALKMLECVAGPLSARLGGRDDNDPSFRPRTIFRHVQASDSRPTSYEHAKDYMTYGVLEVDERGALTVTWKNAKGRVLHQLRI